MTGRMAAPVMACRINSAWLMLQAESLSAKAAYSSSVMRVLTTRLRCGVLYRFMVGRPPFCAWCPLTNRRKTGCEAELFLKNPKKYFAGFFSGASRISRVWGRHSPTRFPQGQNERKANFGTSVESCSKKLPDCRSLALRNCRTAVHLLLPLFQKIATSFFIKGCRIALTCYCHFFGKPITSFFHKRRRAGVLSLLPTNHQRAEWTGFPDNKAFRKLCFARCLKKNGSLFWLHCLIRNFWKFAKNEHKKSSKSFSDLLLRVPL